MTPKLIPLADAMELASYFRDCITDLRVHTANDARYDDALKQYTAALSAFRAKHGVK
jgi:hypothetical protein